MQPGVHHFPLLVESCSLQICHIHISVQFGQILEEQRKTQIYTRPCQCIFFNCQLIHSELNLIEFIEVSISFVIFIDNIQVRLFSFHGC